MTFGDKLREWCISRFGDLQTAADELKIKQPALSRLVNNKTAPGLAFFQKIRKFGCDVNWLVSEVDKLGEPKAEYMDRLLEAEREIRELKEIIKKAKFFLNKMEDK